MGCFGAGRAGNPATAGARALAWLPRIARAAAFLLVFGSIAATAQAADPAKVLRIAFPAAETGFDPVRVSDAYSNTVNEAIYERLLTYDFLARPAKLVPEVAESMPEITDDGRTYTFRIRKGVYFTPDPAFGGKPRELTADDFVYTFKRFVDPKNRSPWAFMLEGRIEGLDELIEAAKRHGRFDYDARVSGLQALDRPSGQLRAWAPNLRPQFTQQYNGFVEYLLGSRSSINVGYVGSRSENLVNTIDAGADPGDRGSQLLTRLAKVHLVGTRNRILRPHDKVVEVPALAADRGVAAEAEAEADRLAGVGVDVHDRLLPQR